MKLSIATRNAIRTGRSTFRLEETRVAAIEIKETGLVVAWLNRRRAPVVA